MHSQVIYTKLHVNAYWLCLQLWPITTQISLNFPTDASDVLKKEQKTYFLKYLKDKNRDNAWAKKKSTPSAYLFGMSTFVST